MSHPTPNTDEGLPHLIGNFHKTLPHDNVFGEVNAADYMAFRSLCDAIESGVALDFEGVARGTTPASAPFKLGPNADDHTARLVSPMASSARETHGPDPRTLEMRPAPEVLSESTAAEMVELYWMALLRDEPLVNLQIAVPPAAVPPAVQDAVDELQSAFGAALNAAPSPGQLALGEDLPRNGNALDLGVQTLFRCGLPGETLGPLVSQFFLRDIPFGTQTINQCQLPYMAGLDFLTTHADWIRAQATGKDCHGRDYPKCNFHADPVNYYESVPRKIATMRDLARFVNRDALHQAYFNAALFLDAVGAPLDSGNPYVTRYNRQGGFATLGGPDLLTLVSEVASRALKAAWRQKWLVHRRARPEAYGGAVEMQVNGAPGASPRPRRAYGLPALVTSSVALRRVQAQPSGTCFLPIAYSAGSPAHPSYGAGHATVAGACVTVLKAWFDESKGFESLLQEHAAAPSKEPVPNADNRLLQPGAPDAAKVDNPTGYAEPGHYQGADAGQLTVGGELNKLASNVAMGRSMGGVHWRSDNTRSLRLGEQVALEILRKRTLEYAERAVSFSFTSFDGKLVQVRAGQVTGY